MNVLFHPFANTILLAFRLAMTPLISVDISHGNAAYIVAISISSWPTEQFGLARFRSVSKPRPSAISRSVQPDCRSLGV